MRFILALVAVALLASTALVFGGGRELNASSGICDVPIPLLPHECWESEEHVVYIDVLQLAEPCAYLTPDDAAIEHQGRYVSILLGSGSASTVKAWACTNQAGPGETPCLEAACFLEGEHYINMFVELTKDGCVYWDMTSLRKGVWYGKAGGTPIPPTYSNPSYRAIETVCGLNDGDTVELLWMSCPDISGPSGPDNRVDLMNDIFGAAFAYGSYKGSPDWNLLADTNEDGVVDLMNDIYSVVWRWDLNCDDFPIS